MPVLTWKERVAPGASSISVPAAFAARNPSGREVPGRTNDATRWLLHNPDQKVASFVLPGTSRPEGFLAAKAAGTLIELAPGATRSFHVSTGIKEKA